MIVKIQPPNPNIEASVNYNESKMNGIEGIRETEDVELKGIEDGHVLVTRNVQEDMSFSEHLEMLRMKAAFSKKAGRKTTNQTFHMSVNPSENDKKLTEKEAVEMIDEIMAGLGYENQPYRIYKHTDIEREHYHVVSSRIAPDGKKIPDSFERLVLRENLKKIAPKYGFHVILSEEEKKDLGLTDEKETDQKQNTSPKETKEKKEAKKDFVSPFTRKDATPVKQQFTNIIEDAMKWHFSTFEQIQALMLRRYHIMLEVQRGNPDECVMLGVDSKAETITPPLMESQLGINLHHMIQEKIDKEKMRNRKEQRERLEKLARAAAKVSESYDEFYNNMYKKGVIVVLSWTIDNEAFGVTYLDRATKCAWKGSETAVDLKWLIETAKSSGWELKKDKYQTVTERRAKLPSRTTIKKRYQEKEKTTADKDTSTQKITTRTKRKGKSSEGIALPTDRNQDSTARIGNGKDDLFDNKDDKPVEIIH